MSVVASARADVAPDGLAAAIDELCAPWSADGSPGCVVTVTRGEEVLHCRGYGLADLASGEPLGPTSAFDIGSLAKQVTAACVLLLADEGRLRLDDDVRQHLPELAAAYEIPAGPANAALPENATRITLAHLVHHTSGFRDYLELLAFAGLRLPGLPAAQLMQLLARQRGLNFAPGTGFRYSNSGYVLLAAVIERAAGRPLAEYAAAAIFRPLGMTGTWFASAERPITAGLVPAYWPAPGGFVAAPASGIDPVGDGGLRTTAEDAARWERNVHHNRLAHGGPHLLRRLASVGRLGDGGERTGYAFGLFAGRLGRQPMLYHGGNAGAQRSALVRLPRQAVSVLCMANLGTLDAMGLARRVAGFCLGLPARAPGRVATRRAAAPAAARTRAAAATVPAQLTGFYRSSTNGRIWHLSTAGGDPPAARAESGPLQATLQPIGPRRLRAEGIVTFELTWTPDRAGNVQRLRFSADGESTTLERVEPVAPGTAELRDYGGTYACDDLEVRHRVRVGPAGGLELVMQGLPFGLPLAPLRRDEFTTQSVVLHFRRDAAGRPDGFAASSPGVSGLRFVRLPAEADETEKAAEAEGSR